MASSSIDLKEHDYYKLIFSHAPYFFANEQLTVEGTTFCIKNFPSQTKDTIEQNTKKMSTNISLIKNHLSIHSRIHNHKKHLSDIVLTMISPDKKQTNITNFQYIIIPSVHIMPNNTIFENTKRFVLLPSHISDTPLILELNDRIPRNTSSSEVKHTARIADFNQAIADLISSNTIDINNTYTIAKALYNHLFKEISHIPQKITAPPVKKISSVTQKKYVYTIQFDKHPSLHEMHGIQSDLSIIRHINTDCIFHMYNSHDHRIKYKKPTLTITKKDSTNIIEQYTITKFQYFIQKYHDPSMVKKFIVAHKESNDIIVLKIDSQYTLEPKKYELEFTAHDTGWGEDIINALDSQSYVIKCMNSVDIITTILHHHSCERTLNISPNKHTQNHLTITSPNDTKETLPNELHYPQTYQKHSP